mmetsp:Transcript_13932/g.38018  ORF Transcript_13932/g.38018 Transcript_13932/m.38018 type:complete len:497 (-) Transcript_13932:1339-2829(-)
MNGGHDPDSVGGRQAPTRWADYNGRSRSRWAVLAPQLVRHLNADLGARLVQLVNKLAQAIQTGVHLLHRSALLLLSPLKTLQLLAEHCFDAVGERFGPLAGDELQLLEALPSVAVMLINLESFLLHVRVVGHSGRMPADGRVHAHRENTGLPFIRRGHGVRHPFVLQLLVILQLEAQPYSTSGYVFHPHFHAFEDGLQVLGLESKNKIRVVFCLGVAKRPLGLSHLDGGENLSQTLRRDAPVAAQHLRDGLSPPRYPVLNLPLLALGLVPHQRVEYLIQAYTFAATRLAVPPPHLGHLGCQRNGRLSGVRDLTIRVHEDREQHVQKDEDHHERERGEPSKGLQKADCLHLVPIPIADHGAKRGEHRAVQRGEVKALLAEEEASVDGEAEVHREKHDREMQQIILGLDESVGDHSEPLLRREGFEEPQHQHQWVDGEPEPKALLFVVHILRLPIKAVDLSQVGIPVQITAELGENELPELAVNIPAREQMGEEGEDD